MTAQERITEWAALADKATRGPWRYLSRNAISTPPIDIDEANWGPEGHSGYRIHTAQDTGAWKYADAALFAASRTAVPAMAAALTAVLERHHRRVWSILSGDSATFAQTEYPDQCDHCRRAYPCPTVEAIETALGVTA